MHKKFILNNGIKVITKNIPHIRSVSIGFWVGTGSSIEIDTNNGISHFIEHMLFKGTYDRNAKDIASTIDSIGGQLNAFTSKEYTCYYSRVLDNHIKIAIDVLSDMILNSKINENDITKEQSVVIEEINMYEDSPEDVVYDLLSKTVFEGHSLSLPILGSHSTVKSLNKGQIIDFMDKNYNPNNMVISVVGSFNDNDLINILNEKIGFWKSNYNKKARMIKPKFNSSFAYKAKDIEQIHLCIGYNGVSNNEEELYPLLIMNNIFGGSMSSRLFQTIREDNGLTYSIYSHPNFYNDFGLFNIYVSLNPSQLDSVYKLIAKEIKKISKESISSRELVTSKEQLKGNYILGLESTGSIMTMLGKSELFDKKIKTPDEIIAKIDNVAISDINNVIDKVFKRNEVSMALVGKIDENQIKNQYEIIKSLN